MFTLDRLKVEGFRGFRGPEEFSLADPITNLFGDNRSAKSSTLNAIEWGLFGDCATGKQTGIRERVGWLIPNQHLPVPAVCVELELASAEGRVSIRRCLRRPARKTALQETLELTLQDGTPLTGAEAEQRLAGLLQSSFRDFMTTVYQHQESIRAILTQEPKDRNDAIDRLLGLSSRRNLLDALTAANLRGRQKEISQHFTDFEDQVRTALSARDNDLAELLPEAQEVGLTRRQLTARTALQAAQSVVEALDQFAGEAELEAPELEVPADWTGLGDYERSTRQAINRLRSQVPGIQEQQQLLHSQKLLLTVQTGLENLQRRTDELVRRVRALDTEHGTRKGVDLKIVDASEKLEAEQERLRQTNGHAAVVHEAITFLEANQAEDTPCPVCGSEVPGLLEQVRRLWTGKLQARVERITARIEELKGRLKELRGIAAAYQRWSDEAEQIQEERTQLREQTATLLARELAGDDDPLALVKSELRRIERRLRQLAEAIQQRQDRLDAILQDLEKVRLIHDYLQLEKKKLLLENIQQSEAFRQLEALRDQIAQLVEDAEAIKDAVAAVSRTEAEAKLSAAEQTIDTYFRQLSRNPAVQHLKLAITTDKRTLRNSYDITDQDGKDLTPILSQGDLNALALAIFLGLAATAQPDSPFGFVLLDDPSQSLGTEHKKQLARVLDQVARHKQLIVATMDGEFHEQLAESLTKARTEYHFGKWTPAKGPSISVQRPGPDTGRSSHRE